MPTVDMCPCYSGSELACEIHGPLSGGLKPPTEVVEFPSGMKRSSDAGKIKYLLVRDGPMLHRWAVHLTRGAEIHEDRNWMLADGPEELERAKHSACRHFEQWLNGDVDEDHAAALFFNVNQVEYIKGRLGAET